MTNERDLLSIYLQDHFAGATAGAQRAERLAEAEQDTADGPALARLADDIEADRQALSALMDVLEIGPSRTKNAVAAVGEKLGALKPNGHLAERSPLSTVVEIEALQMAVRGKRSLWETLQAAMTTPTAIDLGALLGRTVDQLVVLDELHGRRVAETFTGAAEVDAR